MSSNVPITQQPSSDISAPTPQNTPLNHAPIAAGLSRPTVPDITEADEEHDQDEEDDPEGAGGVQAALSGIMQGRLAALLGKSSGYVESLPVEVKKSVAALKGVQVKHTELQNQYKKECLELEKKYLELQKPLYERRRDIISGTAQPTAEEIAAGEKQAKDDDELYTPLPSDAPAAAAPIPEFWLTALRNHVGLSELITDRDAAALKHLRDIRLAYLPSDAPKPGFTLEFDFDDNEFFENRVLTKTYYYQAEVGYSGDFLYERAVGTEIKWKADDKDLTKEFEIKKQRNKNTNRTRLVRKSRPSESFFNFFTPPVPPPESDDEDADVELDDLDELEMKLEVDYQIGEDIKEKIIPRAIDYFTGKALEYESMDEDEDDFEDLDDDDDDEDRFEDQDSDSDEDVPARRRAPPKGRGNQNVDPEECKQQ